MKIHIVDTCGIQITLSFQNIVCVAKGSLELFIVCSILNQMPFKLTI